MTDEHGIEVVGDGLWSHCDARAPETAVTHRPRFSCPVVGRHPMSDCGLRGGCWNPRAEPVAPVTP